MRDHRRFLDILRRADEDRVGLRLVDDQVSPLELDFPAVATIADNDDLWDIEAPVEEVEIEEVSIENKSLDQVVADLVLDEEEAIEGYENAEEAVVANEEISEDEKDEILAVLDHIKEEEEEHIDELTEIIAEREVEVGSEDEADLDIETEESEDGSEKQSKQPLAESRSVADIEAEIARLQAELADVKVAEKKASYGGNMPAEVWYWDMYLDPSEKGTWTSIENDIVFETKDNALDGAWDLLNELDDEGELDYDPDDYYIDAVRIPISKVPADVLKWSGLNHLI